MKSTYLILVGAALAALVGCKAGDGGGRRWEDGCTEYKCGARSPSLNTAQVAQEYGLKESTVAVFLELEAGQNLEQNLNFLGINHREALMVEAGELQSSELINRVARNLQESPAALTRLYSDYVKNLE